MIPQFPRSRKLDIRDRIEIMNYTKQFLPYSDFNFVSLYSYNVQNKIEISWLNKNLVVLFEDYVTGSFFFSFLGNSKIKSTMLTLIEEARKRKIQPDLKLIPEINLEKKENLSALIIKEDHDNDDYILSVEELSTLSGGKYYDKRNLANRFHRLYESYTLKKLNLERQETQNDIIDLFFIWEKKKNKLRKETIHELIAIKRLLKASSKFELHGQGIYIEDRMIAFTIKELLNHEYAIIHFEKSDPTFKGISSFLRRESAKYLMSLGCKYINYEQDLGIEQLSKAKKLWRPVHFLKKYTISRKG